MTVFWQVEVGKRKFTEKESIAVRTPTVSLKEFPYISWGLFFPSDDSAFAWFIEIASIWRNLKKKTAVSCINYNSCSASWKFLWVLHKMIDIRIW